MAAGAGLFPVAGSANFTCIPRFDPSSQPSSPCHDKRRNPRQANKILYQQYGLSGIDRLPFQSPSSESSGSEIGFDNELQSFCQNGNLDMALAALFRMDQHPSEDMYQCLLKACKEKQSVAGAKAVHWHLAFHGLNSSSFLSEYLISTLVKCGSFEDALRLFHSLPYRTPYAWTALISGYVDIGDGRRALDVYQRMQMEGAEPTKYTFVSLFKACIATRDLAQGKALHEDAKRQGLDLESFIASILVNMYGRCGSLKDAEGVFDVILLHDVVFWSAMLSAYVGQGEGEKALELYGRMQEEGMSPDEQSIVIVLQACCFAADKDEAFPLGEFLRNKSLRAGRGVHTDALMRGFDRDTFVGSSLVNMYGKCGSILEAENALIASHEPGVVAWTALISAYFEQEQPEKALQLYRQMQEYGIQADPRAVVMIVQACSMIAEREECILIQEQSTKNMSLQIGSSLHADSLKNGFSLDVFVGSALITMYSKCGHVKQAENVFGQLPERDLALWNAMLSTYVENGEGLKPLQLYKQIQVQGINIDVWTLVIALQACLILAVEENLERGVCKDSVLEICKSLHTDAQRNGLDTHDLVCRLLVTIYGKCASMSDAEKVFREMSLSKKVAATWNVMLTAYVEQGLTDQALLLYEGMQREDVNMDSVTLLCALQVGSLTGSVEICRQVHFIVASILGALSLPMATTLINAYGNCACMVDAQAVFHELPEPDVVAWNALIAGYARDGDYKTTLQTFEEMLLSGTKPNGLTFLPVLSVCNHAGLVDLGLRYFDLMTQECGIPSGIEHYASMVDLLARAGDYARVVSMLSRMPMQPDLNMWLCLLSSCQKHGNMQLGKYAFDQAMLLEPGEASTYVLMSNIYADAGFQTASMSCINFEVCRPELSVQVF